MDDVSIGNATASGGKLQLLQEYYAHDAWMLLIACALMSRVASVALKHECISNFFEQFPTPSEGARGARRGRVRDHQAFGTVSRSHAHHRRGVHALSHGHGRI